MYFHPRIASALTFLALAAEALGQGITWFAPGPITRIESTYIIPAVPRTPINNATQGFWMGMQPSDNNAVIQNVVGNKGIGTGQWGFWPEYCCDPNIFLAESEKVYPGDQLLNRIAQNSSTGEWVMSWYLIPGNAGGANRASPFAGSLVFDPRLYPRKNPFQNAFFVIEVGSPSYWDFGAVMWEDILIEASTTETEWCVHQGVTGHRSVWSMSAPNATVLNGVATCRLDHLKLTGP